MHLQVAQPIVVARLAYLGRADLARALVHQHGAKGGETIGAALRYARAALFEPRELLPPQVARAALERICAPLAAWEPSKSQWGRPRQSGAHAATECAEWLRSKGADGLAEQVLEALAQEGVYEIERALAHLDKETATAEKRHSEAQAAAQRQYEQALDAARQRHSEALAAIDAERQRLTADAERALDVLLSQDDAGVLLSVRKAERAAETAQRAAEAVQRAQEVASKAQGAKP
jgi:hypothetical protein